jgi:mycobactin lysine-N-oxygenase
MPFLHKPHQIELEHRKMRKARLAVLGGGAKAAALAAKAWCLKEGKIADIEIVIFEQHKVGASWDGEHGYTDGEQRLCTHIERDVGFTLC